MRNDRTPYPFHNPRASRPCCRRSLVIHRTRPRRSLASLVALCVVISAAVALLLHWFN